MSSLNYGELCRLCLVKESVSIPIFEGEGDVRRLFFKIATCLPVKVSREDRLPKKICDDCLYKLENQYSFWNSTANAEKQLLQWYELDSLHDEKKIVPTTNLETEQLDLKQEILDPEQGSELSKSLSRVEAVLAGDAGRTNAEEDEEEEESEEEGSNSEESEEDEDNDNDADEPSKEDNESEENYEELEPTTFVNVSLACDEAGPSGMQQQLQEQQSSVPSTSTSGPAASGIETSLTESNSVFVHRPPVMVVRSENTGRSQGVQDIQPVTKQSTGQIYVVPEIELLARGLEREEKYFSNDYLRTPCINSVQLDSQFSFAKGSVGWPFVIEASSGNDCDKKYSCGVCKKTYKNHRSLRSHRLTHSDERPFQCELCDQAFKYKYVLNKHLKVHTGEKRYPCDKCDYATDNRRVLHYHKKRVHDKVHDFICETCGKAFSDPSALKCHLSIHEEKKFKCNQCGKAFHHRGTYNCHMERHDPNRSRLPCEFCGNTFTEMSGLRKHVKIQHLGEKKKSHKCEFCEKVLSSLSSLKVHLRQHTGDRPFSCETCEKSFISKNLLIIHTRVHTGEKPFKCRLCEKSFTQRGTLTVHMRIHSGNRP